MYQKLIFWYIFEADGILRKKLGGHWTVIGIILIDKISLWPILDIPFVPKTFHLVIFQFSLIYKHFYPLLRY